MTLLSFRFRWAETGGESVYKEALRSPSDTKGLVFLDVLKRGQQQRLRSEVDGLSETEAEDKRVGALRGIFLYTMFGQWLITPFGSVMSALLADEDRWDDKYWSDTEKAEYA